MSEYRRVQLPLGVGLRAGPTFANFEAGAAPEAVPVVAATAMGVGERAVYLWGGSGCGKTHLLEAACQEAVLGGRRAGYLPLAHGSDLAPEVLRGLENLDLLCVDDLQAVAGERRWEEALFHLYNRAEMQQAALIVAATASPSGIGLRLPDLVSRLSAAAVFRLRPLEDPLRCRALRQRARERGFDIPTEVAEYLIRRCPRDMHTLFGLLEQLDSLTLAEQRRVTIPFVKEILGA